MAPLSLATANGAYERAITRLKRACVALDCKLPPVDPQDQTFTEPPASKPVRDRVDSVAACAVCQVELEALEPGLRDGHICNHQQEGVGRQSDQQSVHGSDGGRSRAGGTLSRKGKYKQPTLKKIKDYMANVASGLDVFSDAVSDLCVVLPNTDEKEEYKDHLMVWVRYVEELNDRAEELIEILEADDVQVVDNAASAPKSSTGNVAGTASNATVVSASGTASVNTVTASPSGPGGVPSIAPAASFTLSSSSVTGNPGLDMAVRRMNMVGKSIHEDLLALEQEVAIDGLNEATVARLNDFCKMIQEAIEDKYVESSGKLAELDVSGSTNALKIMEDNVEGFQNRLRQSKSSLRQSVSGSNSGASTPPSLVNSASVLGSSARGGTQGYKPFLERLKPPVFSGKIEDWPEFRSVWKDLLSDYPESVQVQHLKSNIPAADAKRVVGVKTCSEISLTEMHKQRHTESTHWSRLIKFNSFE